MSKREKKIPLSAGMRLSPAPKPTKYFTVKRSKIAGRGAFATAPIRKGAIIIEYAGYWVTPEEEEAHYKDDQSLDHHTFLFYVDKSKTIDASYNGNEARFLNHACDPNCETVIRNRRVFIKAIKPIDVGEELVYDYSFIFWGPLEKNWKIRYRCRCGSSKCRGYMLDPSMLKKALKAKNKTAVPESKAGNKLGKKGKGAKKKKTTGRKKPEVHYVR